MGWAECVLGQIDKFGSSRLTEVKNRKNRYISVLIRWELNLESNLSVPVLGYFGLVLGLRLNLPRPTYMCPAQQQPLPFLEGGTAVVGPPEPHGRARTIMREKFALLGDACSWDLLRFLNFFLYFLDGSPHSA